MWQSFRQTALVIGLSLSIFLFSVQPVFAHGAFQHIDMTSSGFSPAQVTISQNQTLEFVNLDREPHWPASDVHPTHDLYKEFDPTVAIEAGKSWTFRFTKAGKWGFHDHLNPHRRGVVTVIGENKTNGLFQFFKAIEQVIVQAFSRLNARLSVKNEKAMPADRFQKLSQKEQTHYLQSLADGKGAESAWNFILTSFKGQPGTTGNIHDLAHFVGGLLYEHKGMVGLSSCTPTFAFGCYHGFLDRAFQKSLDGLVPAYEACLAVGKANSGPFASCIHGIGHGIASFFGVSDLNQSLSACQKLEQGKEYCYDGVFMEFVRSSDKNFYRADDNYYPCTTLDERYQHACGRNQDSVFKGRFQKPLAERSALCLLNPNAAFRSGCIDAIGFSSVNDRGTDAVKIVQDCTTLKDAAAITQCATSAAGELAFQDVPNWQTVAQAICSQLSQASARNCQSYVDHIAAEYSRNQTLRPKSSNEQADTYVQQMMGICYQNGGKDDCYHKVADLFSQAFSLKDMLALFKKNENVKEVYARCHEVTHFLSRNELTKVKTIPAVYASCDSTCHGGCYHGALEQNLKDKQIAFGSNQVPAEISRLCEEVKSSDKPIIYYECLHGLGHAAMFVTDMDIPASLQLCDQLQEEGQRIRCYSGAFMENSSSSTNIDHPGRFIKADDPLYPCTILETKYLSTCYRYQSSYFALLTKNDWQKTAALCLQVPKEYQRECFQTIGTNQVGFTQDTEVMKADCAKMPTKAFKATCLQGIVISLVYRFVGDSNRIVSFCSSISDGEDRNACFTQMGFSLRDWSTSQKDIEKWCQNIKDTNDRNSCLLKV